MPAEKPAPQTFVLLAPLSGIIMPLEMVPDPTFAQKMVGDGLALDPVSELLLAPAAGRITLLHPAHHALTLTTPEGLEILIHIGLNTVTLKGRGFTPRVTEGDLVRPGDPLIAFDATFLADRAASLLTMMLVSNGEKVAECLPSAGWVEAGVSPALKLIMAQGEETADGCSSGLTGRAAESEEIVILNPQGLHARPTAVLTNGAKRFQSDLKLCKESREANAKSVVAVLGLDVKQHDRVKIRAFGPDAAEAVESLAGLIKTGLGESLHGGPRDPAPPSPPPLIQPSNDLNILKGVSASPGLVTGRIHQLRIADITVSQEGAGPEKERETLLTALARAKKDLAELQNQLRLKADVGKAAIFAAHQEILEDPELLAATESGISQGQSAAWAWRITYQSQADTLAQLKNELLAGRANDIRDVGRRVLLILTAAEEGSAEIPENSILVAEDLTPSDTASLDRRRVLGFCTIGGGATSHVAILARSAGLPAIAAIEARALNIPSGVPAILDGDRAELRLNPSPAEVARVHEERQAMARRWEKELAMAVQPALTLDGRRIKAAANISGLAEAEESVSLGGDGVGLLRSEFLFLQRSEAPTEEEQASVYTAIAQALGPERDLVVRTLDVGGDKPLAYFPLPPEVNPFLGIRGIRLNMLDEGLLRSQIRAIWKAAPYSRLHLMFPMVSTVEEIRRARALVDQERAGSAAEAFVGIMVEVPSAAILAEGLAAEVDFFSIGTNDLTQYTLAIDRGHSRLAKMADGLHPAVLSLIGRTVQGAHKHGKWVGVCGGLAGETPAIPILIGLGVDELSVSVSALPQVKAAIRRLNFSECQKLAEKALSKLTAAEVRELTGAYWAEKDRQ